MLRTLTLIALLLVGFGQIASAKEENKPRPKTLRGIFSKVDGGTLTVITRGDSGEKTHAINVDAKTLVERETDLDETTNTGEGGRPVTRAKREKVALTDLKEGVQLSVTYVENQPATSVLVLRPKKSKEKERE